MILQGRPWNYILNDAGDPVPEPDVVTWARWFASHPDARRVALSDLGGGIEVSTVFLGADHQLGNGAPLLYETIIFGGEYDQQIERYHTRAAAEAGHARIGRELRGALNSQANHPPTPNP
jgi:hypothetical protein